MRKIIETLKNVKLNGKDQYQTKSLLNIMRFFVIMLILTLVSRGTAGAIMPKVTLQKVSEETLVDKIDIAGQLELSNHMKIEIEPNIKINNILVEAGEKVEEGDPLLEYDKSDVDFLVQSLDADINKLEIQYNQLLKGDEVDMDGVTDAKDNLTDVEEDQATSKINRENTLGIAAQEVAEAKKELSNLENQYDEDSESKDNAMPELKAAQQALVVMQTKEATINVAEAEMITALDLKTELEKELAEMEVALKALEDNTGLQDEIDKLKMQIEAKKIVIKDATQLWTEAETVWKALQPELIGGLLEKAQQRVDNANTIVNTYEGKKESVKSSIDQAEKLIAGANQGLNMTKASVEKDAVISDRQLEAAQKSLNYATNDYDQSQEQIQDSQALNAADAKILQISLEEKRQQLEVLHKIQEANYLKLATQKGILLNWNIKERELGQEVAGIITDDSLGYQFIFTINEDDMEEIKHGMEIIITQNYQEVKAVITKIGEQKPDKTYSITAKVEDENLREGSAYAYVHLSEQSYEACIPSSALRQDGKGSYVLGVEERNTILGIQNVVYRINVSIEEIGDGFTAVGGALYRGNDIISYSDKAINSGDRVRIDS